MKLCFGHTTCQILGTFGIPHLDFTIVFAKRLAVIHEGSYPTNRNISIPNKTLLILHQEACPYSPRKHKITATEVLFAKDDSLPETPMKQYTC